MVSPLSRNPAQAQFGWGFGRMGHRPHSEAARHADGTRTLQRLLAVQRTSESGIDLQIQTDEGDTVTISLHSETDLTTLSYRYKSRGPEGKESLRLRASELSSSQEMSITVEGSLSEEELADVKELVDRVKLAVQSFFSGDASEEEALALANTDGESLESLAGFRLDMEHTETMQAVALRMREWKPAPEPLPAAPVEAAAETAPEATVADAAPEVRPADAEAKPAVAKPAEDVSWILQLLQEAAGIKTSLLA